MRLMKTTGGRLHKVLFYRNQWVHMYPYHFQPAWFYPRGL